MKICCVSGTRPNLVKMAAVVRALEERPGLSVEVVHTGQHHDESLFEAPLRDVGLPQGSRRLEIQEGPPGRRIASIMASFEAFLQETDPDLVLVAGDVDSTVACALVAARHRIALGHVEAGLRSFDRSMPEELNRVTTDALSDLLFATEPSAVANLSKEGVPEDNVFFVGNTMIDTLLARMADAGSSTILRSLGLRRRSYGVVTLHRPSNVDDPARLAGFTDLLLSLGARAPLVFPAHPRTLGNLRSSGLLVSLQEEDTVRVLPPLGYLDFLQLLASCRFVLTDSGGVQEEATILGVPCYTARDHTERPITIEQGTNTLVGSDPEHILSSIDLDRPVSRPGSRPRPRRWDGRASRRIAKLLSELGVDGLSGLQARRSGGPSEITRPGEFPRSARHR